VIQRAINMATNADLSSRSQLFDNRAFINLLIKHILNLSPMLFYYRLLLQASITLTLAILVLSSSYNFLQVANALLHYTTATSTSMSSKSAVLGMINLQMGY
jgi:hypothetical protein